MQGLPAGWPSAEAALRWLLLSQPEEAVYRAALGTYHLDLAYLVVGQCQVLQGGVPLPVDTPCLPAAVACPSGC